MQEWSGGRECLDSEPLLKTLTWTCGLMPGVRNVVAQIRSLTFSAMLTINGLNHKSRDNHKKIEYDRRALVMPPAWHFALA